jgi:heptosyltransferase-2
MFRRILVIRGGAIGDFILTLPGLHALRTEHAGAHIEILGYPHIAVLAENRFYAQAMRSIEYAPLSSFFATNSELAPELASYFASFELIISYLYDPDRIFESNLRRCHAQKIVFGPAKLNQSQHAAKQLAGPVKELGIRVGNFAARLYPSSSDRGFASNFLGDSPRPTVVLHPGSGSEKKNWPIESWIELGDQLLKSTRFGGRIVIVSGEADEKQTVKLESIWKDQRVRFARNLPLPHLAAILEHAIFIGHDSGISHIAAAAGANCVLLFGATNPAIWAPLNDKLRLIRGDDGKIENIQVHEVEEALRGTWRL